jgi:hypothetical protein
VAGEGRDLALFWEIYRMKKFAPLIIAAAVTSFAGCAMESSDVASNEQSEEQAAVACSNADGTNGMIAALAVALATDMHRWNVLTDLFEFRGFNNQLMLGITAAGKAACGGTNCPTVANILAFQDSRLDQKAVIAGTKLSSWALASRLTAGWDKQKACQQPNGWCLFQGHQFAAASSINAGNCNTSALFSFPASKAGGGALTAAQIAALNNALVFTTANGTDPFVQFTSNTTSVSVGDVGGMVPGQAEPGPCQQFSISNINGTACSCAATGVTTGQLKNDQSLAPNTYFCRKP